MPPKQETGGSAIDQIRDSLRQGAYRPGAPLPIAELASRLGLSQTPIREALARLAGEGMVLERRGAGYFVEALDAQALAELHRLHELLVVAAVRTPRRRAPAAGHGAGRIEEGDIVRSTEVLFGTLVGESGDMALVREHRRLSDRLAPSRFAELDVLVGLDVELAELGRFAGAGDVSVLVGAISAYHLRRTAIAADIVSTMRSRWIQ